MQVKNQSLLSAIALIPSAKSLEIQMGQSFAKVAGQGYCWDCATVP
jgi:hypothetical protein